MLTERIYPQIGDDVSELKSKYKNNILKFSNKNSEMITKNPSDIRIASFNVHFWTDMEEQSNINKIYEVIKEIKADIICLQEVKIGEMISNMIDEYSIVTLCNTTPSWFEDAYGNAILIKTETKIKLQKSNLANEYKMHLCGEQNRCILSQFNKTFDDLECCKSDSEEIMAKNKETRCFTKISLPYFDIINTHLEAYDSKKRELELIEINKFITRETIVTGDFNMISKQDYGNEFKKDYIDHEQYKKFEIQSHGRDIIDSFADNVWTDITSIHNTNFINLTAWSGTRIDYMFYVVPIHTISFQDEITKIADNVIGLKREEIGKYLFENKEVLDKIEEACVKFEKEITKIQKYTEDSNENITDKLKQSINKIKDLFKNKNTIEEAMESNKINKNGYDMYPIQETFGELQTYMSRLKNATKIKINKFGTYFSDASDHLPIFTDIELSNIMSTQIYTPGLKEIEQTESYQKNKYIELSYSKFIETWNKINGTSNTETEFYVYNGQPGKSHNWFNFESQLTDGYIFKDPFNFGNSKGSNALGNEGVYGAKNYDSANKWAESFINAEIGKNNNHEFITKKIIFKFRIVFDSDIKICYIGNEKEWMNYDTNMDRDYDIIVGEGFSEIKITKRGYDDTNKKNKYLILDSKYTDKDFTFKNTYITAKIKDNCYKLNKKSAQAGGNLKDMYKKYIKYKTKYEKLKSQIKSTE